MIEPDYIDLIRQLDHQSNQKRREIIVDLLRSWGVDYRLQPYATGVNIYVDLGDNNKRIGVSSHFDRVEGSPGANDNASAIAVCLQTIRNFQRQPDPHLGLRIFFFDEEETGLNGSAAYIRQFGITDLSGLLNLELVGMGDQFALWPLDDNAASHLLTTFEACARQHNIPAQRFDKIVTNTADHLSFRSAGLADAFTITCISGEDLATAAVYYNAMAAGVSAESLFRLLSQAPIFKTYHQPGDSYKTINEASILMTAKVIWDTIPQLYKFFR